MLHQIQLLALIPNQHTGLILQRMRDSLYREFGCASALAFEPIIPLAIVPYVPEKHKVINLLTPPENSTVAVPAFSSRAFSISSGHLFLETSQTGLVEEVQSVSAALTSSAFDHPAGPFPLPLYPGLFFSQIEALHPCPIPLPAEPLKWRSNRVGLYEIVFDEGNQPWWDGLEWALVWDFPFRIWKKRESLSEAYTRSLR